MYTFYITPDKKIECTYKGYQVALKDVPNKHLVEVMENYEGLITNGMWHTSV